MRIMASRSPRTSIRPRATFELRTSWHDLTHLSAQWTLACLDLKGSEPDALAIMVRDTQVHVRQPGQSVYISVIIGIVHRHLPVQYLCQSMIWIDLMHRLSPGTSEYRDIRREELNASSRMVLGYSFTCSAIRH